MANKIMALTGPKSSGKSTLADYLMRSHDFVVLPFAKPIKLMLSALLYYEGVPDDRIHSMLNGDQKEIPTALLGGKSPRFAMQTLGSEWRDLMDKNLWLNAWTENSRFLSRVVVDDLRFKHEVERIRQLKGQIILIHRPKILDSDQHSSETEWKDIPFDGVITNDGTVNQLFAKMEKLL